MRCGMRGSRRGQRHRVEVVGAVPQGKNGPGVLKEKPDMSQSRETVHRLECIAMTAACTVLAGCASVSPNLTNYDAKMIAPLPQDQARVCFVRQSAMLGAIVPHSVLDCGSNIVGDVSFIETSCWVPASRQTVKEFFPDEAKLGTWLLEKAVGREIARDKPACFTVGRTPAAIQPNSDLMDAAYMVLPEETLQRTGLSGTPIMTGSDYVWGVSDDMAQPRLFVRLPAVGDYGLTSVRKIKQIPGTEAVKLMGKETGKNARYCGTVRSGGSIVFDRPEGTMRIRVVTPGGDTAFAPDFTVQKGRKYVVVYTYGFSGVNFAISERAP